MNISETYICGHAETFKDCGVFDHPLGFTNASGDFVQICQHCENSWIAITAQKQELDAEERMKEAKQAINPALRAFLAGK